MAATTLAWAETVTSGTYDAPRKAAALYAADAVLWGTEVCGPDDDLWGTVSESVRDTPQQIYAYFVSFSGCCDVHSISELLAMAAGYIYKYQDASFCVLRCFSWCHV